MKRDEFIKLCQRCGYCTKKEAEEFSGDREEFTDDDFMEAYRYAQRMSELRSGCGKWHCMPGGRTTKSSFGGDPSNR